MSGSARLGNCATDSARPLLNSPIKVAMSFTLRRLLDQTYAGAVRRQIARRVEHHPLVRAQVREGDAVTRGQVIGRCEDTTGIEPFSRLVTQVMTSEPYASADRVFWIVDNGSSHRGAASKKRLRQVDSRIILVHTPVHASWLNQVEIYFSIIQRKVLTPNDCADLEAIRLRLRIVLGGHRP